MDEPTTPLDRAQLRKRLRERAATLGQLGGQVAHDVNNIFGVTLTGIEMALRVGDVDKANGFLAAATRMINGARTLTDRLAEVSRSCELASDVDLHALIAEVAEQQRAELGAAVNLVTRLDAPRHVVRIDDALLRLAILNLIGNARDAMPAGGTLTVLTRNQRGMDLRADSGREYVVVAVSDTGIGMPGEVRNVAFDLFFSTKPGCYGMGLTQARDAVRRVGGFATIESAPEAGTTVTLGIPLETVRAG